MRSVFLLGALPLLLLFILDGSLLPAISVKAFPASATSALASATTENKTSSEPTHATDTALAAGEITDYPVFISVTEETQVSPETVESEVVTEAYMVIEDKDQEIDDDENNSDSSTVTPVVVRSTTPMQSPKSSPEQEEVLRELKKLWDLSEGMNDGSDDALKNSLSSIVHLAYARVYIEPDETLLKLKYLLQQLQERILRGTNSNNASENLTATYTEVPTSSSLPPAIVTTDATTTGTPLHVAATVTTTSPSKNDTMRERKRRKRSFYDGYDDDVEAIFFANINSEENSVVPEETDHYQPLQPQNLAHDKMKPSLADSNDVNFTMQIINGSNANVVNSIDRTLLSVGTFSSISTTTTAPSTASLVQKVIHIHDRQKPMPSFYLSPERINELKSRVTSTTSSTPTSTLSPISIIIDDELENEVNLLQQQQQVDNYDIHISSAETLVPLTSATPPNSSFHKWPLSEGSTIVISPSSTTEMPFTAEDIALALFQLLRPDTFDDDESGVEENVTLQPHPTPSSILYQVGALSSVLNFTINAKNASLSSNSSSSTTTAPTTEPSNTTTQVPLSSTIASPKRNATLSLLKLKEKYMTKNKNNATLLIPAAFLDLDMATSTAMTTPAASTSTERQNLSQNHDIYDYTDVLDQTPTGDQSSITTTIVQETQENIQQVVDAVTGLSVGAKIVLLFSVSISIISIGFGLYGLGPPLTGVGILGIIIPVGLLILFETSASSGGKRKLTMRQQEQLLINKLQSEEFSKVLDLIFEAANKYSKQG